MQKEWLIMREVQELLNYSSRNAVYRFVKMHGVRASNPAGTTYYSYSDIMNVLNNHAVVMGI